MKFIQLLVILACLSIHTQSAVISTYINRIRGWWPPKKLAASLGVPGYGDETEYNVFMLTYWQDWGPGYAVDVWDKLYRSMGKRNPFGNTTQAIQRKLHELYAEEGKKILVSGYGNYQFPLNSRTDPEKSCGKLAQYAKDNHLDGIDINMQDDWGFYNGRGMEDWIINCTKAARKVLPSPDYIITHYAKAYYFLGGFRFPKGGYLRVNQEVGHLVDWYHVAFFEAYDSHFESYESLFEHSGGWAKNVSVSEIINSGVDANKVVIVKPAKRRDSGNTGHVHPVTLKGYFERAQEELGWQAGFSTWQYDSDKHGQYVNIVAEAFQPNTTVERTYEVMPKTQPDFFLK